MKHLLKAIETSYKGYKFRSRLEARWAVFFDTLDTVYRYEPEGYSLDGIWYLPDFFLPQQQCWLEIKPDIPTYEEREKAIRLCIASRKPVTIFAGDVWQDVAGFGFAPMAGETKHEVMQYLVKEKIHWLSTTECISVDEQGDFWGMDFTRGYKWSNAYWAECDNCGAAGILTMNCAPCEDDPDLYSNGGSRLSEAYIAARQARFEHGKGKVMP